MIEAIEIEGFRSLRSTRLEVRPLNVLIGPNQSGKTNFLDALDLLKRAALRGSTRGLDPAITRRLGQSCSGPGRAGGIRFKIELSPGRRVKAAPGLLHIRFDLRRTRDRATFVDDRTVVRIKQY